MKNLKFIGLFCLMFVTTMCYPQSVKDCRTTITATSSYLKIENTSSCKTGYVLQRTGFPDTIISAINANCSAIINLTIPCGEVKIKSLIECSCTCDEDWLSLLTTNCNILPVNISSLRTQVNEKTTDVWFAVGENTNVAYFFIRKTKDDGKTFTRVKYIAKESLKPGITYHTTIQNE